MAEQSEYLTKKKSRAKATAGLILVEKHYLLEVGRRAVALPHMRTWKLPSISNAGRAIGRRGQVSALASGPSSAEN